MQELCLDFTVEVEQLGVVTSEELLPGGSHLAVTADNLLQVGQLGGCAGGLVGVQVAESPCSPIPFSRHSANSTSKGVPHPPPAFGTPPQYVHLLAEHHLNRRLGTAAAAFGRGMERIIPPTWLRLFSAKEVNALLGGGGEAAAGWGPDVVDDMQAHAQYRCACLPALRCKGGAMLGGEEALA